MLMTSGAGRFAAALLLGVVLAFLATAPAAAQSEVVLEKLTNGQNADSPPGPIVVAGDPITWTYEVTNASGRDLSNIVVTDDQGVMVSCPGTTLSAGTSMTCTGSGIALEGQYANVGTVDAETPDGSPASDTDPSHYFGTSAPVVTIEKSTEGFDADTPPGPSLPVGSSVSWTYEVANTGAEGLMGITVSDDQGAMVSCPQDTLAPGESMTCTASGVVQPGQYENLGTVMADTASEAPVAASDPSHYFGQVLILEKSTEGVDADVAPGPALDPGDPVTWTYEVSNPGPAAVTNLQVTDDQGVMVSCPQTTLAAGESVVCTASGTVQLGQYANVGTASAELPLGGVVSANDPSHYFGSTIAIEKSTNGQDADSPPGPTILVGDPVAWTYEVTNFGTDPLTTVTVTDDQGVMVSCPQTTLAAGESMTCTASGTAVEGPYTNVGTATADGPGMETLGDSDPSHYLGMLPPPDVAASKTVALLVDVDGDGEVDPGDTLSYTATITNSGTVDATLVVFTDTPDANTTLVAGSVTATQGTVTTGNTGGDTSVAVDVGTLAAGGGSATITFEVTVNDPLPSGVTEIVNQGVVSGENFADVPTDDPAEPGSDDPTAVAVAATSEVVIPVLDRWGLLALLLLLAGAGALKLGAAR
jgi:uncharacterized repeat protein (TIGR01451 family)